MKMMSIRNRNVKMKKEKVSTQQPFNDYTMGSWCVRHACKYLYIYIDDIKFRCFIIM